HRPAGVKGDRATAREKLLDAMQKDFVTGHSSAPSESHRAAYRQALTMMNSKAVKAFDLSDEPAKLRDRYGRNLFGQGCLLARRLIETGVPFVEVTLSAAPGVGAVGWDTHQNNFDAVKELRQALDPAWATLMDDQKDQALQDPTTNAGMGQYSRPR